MISLKSDPEIGFMREAATVVKKVLQEVEAAIRIGMTTADLDQIAEDVIQKEGAKPAFKGYKGYPNAACISINEEVVHGVPGRRKIREGDLISFDVGVELKGYFADAARTWTAGKTDEKKKLLVDTARNSLKVALESYRPGWRIGDLSSAIQKFVESQGFSVVRNYVGHGIGRLMHEDPQVPNYGEPGNGPKMQPGLVLAIEPMVTEGHYDVEVLQNGWTVVTRDRKLASHYEDTVAFLKEGFINLTGDLQ